ERMPRVIDELELVLNCNLPTCRGWLGVLGEPLRGIQVVGSPRARFGTTNGRDVAEPAQSSLSELEPDGAQAGRLRQGRKRRGELARGSDDVERFASAREQKRS